MTPKEKAIELITKFRLFQSISYDEDGGMVNNYNISKHNAKQSAIICVDEILSLNVDSYEGESNPHHYYSRSYWHEVKTEIEKL